VKCYGWRQRGPPKRWYPITPLLHPEDGGSIVFWNVGILSHQHFTLKMEAAWSSETFITYRISTSPWSWRQHGPPKRWHPITSALHPDDGGSMVPRNVGNLPHRLFILKVEAATWFSELVSYHISISPWRRKQHFCPKHLFPTILVHGVTIQKTTVWISWAVCWRVIMLLPRSWHCSQWLGRIRHEGYSVISFTPSFMTSVHSQLIGEIFTHPHMLGHDRSINIFPHHLRKEAKRY
jgi:hypothetical protein